jgi:toxin ParE1/3/4
MKRRVRRNRQVREDLIAIYVHIHRRSPQGAEKVLDALERSITSLLDTPKIGRLWESPDPRLEGLRVAVSTPYRNYLIFFRPVAYGIEVFRVIHGAQELARIVDEIQIDFEDVD